MDIHQKTLREAGIAPTPQRLAIARVLFVGHQHMTADQLYARVNQGEKSVSRATIYNTLGLFSRKGLVKEIYVDASRTFYDTNTGPHFHLYNVDTQTLTDMQNLPAAVHLSGAIPEGTSLEGIDAVVRIRNGSEQLQQA